MFLRTVQLSYYYILKAETGKRKHEIGHKFAMHA